MRSERASLEGNAYLAGRSRWHQAAACRGLDPELFFPQPGESTSEAEAVCARCEVQLTCRDYAINKPERFGIWGATGERQRRRIRRGPAS